MFHNDLSGFFFFFCGSLKDTKKVSVGWGELSVFLFLHQMSIFLLENSSLPLFLLFVQNVWTFLTPSPDQFCFLSLCTSFTVWKPQLPSVVRTDVIWWATHSPTL